MTSAELASEVASCDWYHTIEFPGGIVTPGWGIVTPGWFDCRPALARVPLPDSLTGLRALEVGTWDGFWAFELERRGAAEVVAIDVEDAGRWDWPPRSHAARGRRPQQEVLEKFKAGGRGFEIARRALGSTVRRHDVSVYELDPAHHGHFDFVFLGSLLLHLRDPVQALERLRSVCSGEAVISEAVELIPSLLRPRTPTARLEGVDRPWWWQPNVAAVRQMVRSAGWRMVEGSALYAIPRGAGQPLGSSWRQWRRAASARGREELVTMAWGVPHTAVRALP